MLRWIVAIASLGTAGGILAWLAFIGVNTPAGTILTNLGTELVGIVITVAVVEWFFERRRHQTRGRQLAWDALHAVEHAVWVWQGGPREMDTDEVLGILDAVGADDPLPDFTEGLLLNIGTRSRRLLNNDPEAVSASPGLHGRTRTPRATQRGSGRENAHGLWKSRRHSRAGDERTRQISG
jgi:hypothetical protein